MYTRIDWQADGAEGSGEGGRKGRKERIDAKGRE
jgi:hypothetical protein